MYSYSSTTPPRLNSSSSSLHSASPAAATAATTPMYSKEAEKLSLVLGISKLDALEALKETNGDMDRAAELLITNGALQQKDDDGAAAAMDNGSTSNGNGGGYFTEAAAVVSFPVDFHHNAGPPCSPSPSPSSFNASVVGTVTHTLDATDDFQYAASLEKKEMEMHEQYLEQMREDERVARLLASQPGFELDDAASMQQQQQQQQQHQDASGRKLEAIPEIIGESPKQCCNTNTNSNNGQVKGVSRQDSEPLIDLWGADESSKGKNSNSNSNAAEGPNNHIDDDICSPNHAGLTSSGSSSNLFDLLGDIPGPSTQSMTSSPMAASLSTPSTTKSVSADVIALWESACASMSAAVLSPKDEDRLSTSSTGSTKSDRRVSMHVRTEMLQTERNYMERIEKLYALMKNDDVIGHIKALDPPLGIGPDDVNQILQTNKSLLKALESGEMETASVFARFAPFLVVYSNYLSKLNIHAITALKDHEWFRELNSLLVSPMQRLPRYVLLLERLSKSEPEDSEAQKAAAVALELVKNSVKTVNAKVGESEKQRQVLTIQNAMLGVPVALQIVEPHRKFVASATVKVWRDSAEMRVEECFLFNDIIIMAIPWRNTKKFCFMQRIDFRGMQSALRLPSPDSTGEQPDAIRLTSCCGRRVWLFAPFVSGPSSQQQQQQPHSDEQSSAVPSGIIEEIEAIVNVSSAVDTHVRLQWDRFRVRQGQMDIQIISRKSGNHDTALPPLIPEHWERFWLILSGGTLYWHRMVEGRVLPYPSGVLPLTKITFHDVDEEGGKVFRSFHSARRAHFFRPLSAFDGSCWIATLKNSVEAIRLGNVPPPKTMHEWVERVRTWGGKCESCEKHLTTEPHYKCKTAKCRKRIHRECLMHEHRPCSI